MKYITGLIGIFTFITYMAFLGRDTSTSFYDEAQLSVNESKENSKEVTNDKESLSRAPASEKSSGQSGLLELRERANEVNNRSDQSASSNPSDYAPVEDDYDDWSPQNTNNNRVQANNSSSNQARGNFPVSPRQDRSISDMPRNDNTSTSQNNNSNNGFDTTLDGKTVITGGGLDSNNESQSETTQSDDDSTKTSGSSSSSSGSSTPQLSCSSSTEGGSFSNPLNVDLSCNNTSATIRYCLDKDQCCDPDSSPNAKEFDPDEGIDIGLDNGNYCLSYYGSSDSLNQDTTIDEHNFTFNSNFPDLVVDYSKRWIQTTQVNEKAEISSSDFGEADHFLGQINYVTNDLSDPSLTCYDLALNEMGYNSPTPTEPLEFFDVSAFLPSQQYDLFYSPDELEYSENQLITYLVNDQYDAPLISCQQTTVVLEDFHVTDQNPTHIPPSESFGQIQGQFTSYGFFEEDPEVERFEQGQSIAQVSDVELRQNFLSILYQE